LQSRRKIQTESIEENIMRTLTRIAGSLFTAAAIAVAVAPAAGAAVTDHDHHHHHGDGYSYAYGYGFGPGTSSSYGYQDPWSDADAGNYGECYGESQPAFCYDNPDQ
jgi:hypothetical protein